MTVADPTILAAAIRDRLDEDKGAVQAPYLDAIGLLLGLHIPDGFTCCRHDGYEYPCDTLTTIATALGITESDRG
ncbi:MAG TPA: hypothetical protein VIS06_21260 [Mycobacteriales bacterium]|jgi:hypothetical protein